jgi:hypothetical protein
MITRDTPPVVLRVVSCQLVMPEQDKRDLAASARVAP